MSPSPKPSIASMWERFEQYLPANLSQTRLREFRRAFYTGAASVMALLTQIEEDTPEDEGAEVFEGIDQELKAFFENQG